jgi:hypothetical protein
MWTLQETVKRLRGAISFWDVIKIIRRSDDALKSPPPFMQEPFHELETAVERLKTRETVRELMAWMEADFPDVVNCVVFSSLLVYSVSNEKSLL